jgi:hypothetical protein
VLISRAFKLNAIYKFKIHTWGTPTPPARKNIVQFFWELAEVAGVVGGRGVAMHLANSRKNWVVFFLAGGVGVPHVSSWRCWCAPRVKLEVLVCPTYQASYIVIYSTLRITLIYQCQCISTLESLYLLNISNIYKS